MKSGNQEQICVKLDRSVLAALTLEQGVSGLTRNRIINRAILAYTMAIDHARAGKAGEISRDSYIKWFLSLFTRWLLDPLGSTSFVVKKEGDK